MLIITQTALELGFLYALVAMALFLSYRILDIADLTTDGCFVLGAAVSVTVTAAGHPVLAIFAAMLAGACAGFVTAFLQTKLGVPSILAGIVTNTGLYTINLMAMGWKSNQSLLGGKTVFTMLRETGIGGEWYELLLAAFVTILAGLLLVLFLGTRMGLSIRATGDNPDMVRASSLNPSFTITVGLCLANMLTALSGAIVGQYQKTVDINSGTGIVVIGLACLIIGETLLGRRSVKKGVIAAILGSIVYRFIYAIVFYTKIVPVECLKLLTAIIVALAIAAPSIQKWARFCLLCILKNNILSQRLNAICVNYSCVNSFFLQFLSSFHCNFYHQTAANKCYVTAILKNITSANLIYFSIFENISCLISSKSQISRSIICHHCCESSFLISNVCCYEHFKIRKCSHN